MRISDNLHALHILFFHLQNININAPDRHNAPNTKMIFVHIENRGTGTGKPQTLNRRSICPSVLLTCKIYMPFTPILTN